MIFEKDSVVCLCFEAKFPKLKQRRFHIERLSKFFTHDQMTGLFNKGEVLRDGTIKGIKYEIHIKVVKAEEWEDHVSIRYTSIDNTDESIFLEIMKNPTISKFLAHYETNINTEMPLKVCLEPIVDKNKYEYRTTFFPSKIKTIEDFGELSLRKIEFDVEKSPLGLDRLTFGTCSLHLHFSLKIIIMTESLSNLVRIFRKQFELLNVFIRIR